MALIADKPTNTTPGWDENGEFIIASATVPITVTTYDEDGNEKWDNRLTGLVTLTTDDASPLPMKLPELQELAKVKFKALVNEEA